MRTNRSYKVYYCWVFWIWMPASVYAQDTSKKTHQLDEVIIHSPYQKWAHDSVQLRSTYAKTFRDHNRKMKLKFSNGIIIDGIISEPINMISGRRKRNKKFLQQLETTEQEKFTYIRYNPEIVMKLLPLNKEEAVLFIGQNPMEYTFSRTASELELQQWIRDTYRIRVKK